MDLPMNQDKLKNLIAGIPTEQLNFQLLMLPLPVAITERDIQGPSIPTLEKFLLGGTIFS